MELLYRSLSILSEIDRWRWGCWGKLPFRWQLPFQWQLPLWGLSPSCPSCGGPSLPLIGLAFRTGPGLQSKRLCSTECWFVSEGWFHFFMVQSLVNGRCPVATWQCEVTQGRDHQNRLAMACVPAMMSTFASKLARQRQIYLGQLFHHLILCPID